MKRIFSETTTFSFKETAMFLNSRRAPVMIVMMHVRVKLIAFCEETSRFCESQVNIKSSLVARIPSLLMPSKETQRARKKRGLVHVV